ncbi:flagellar basal body P-ring formation chaperone FlgA [Desulforhabdus amnigena]|uniref:SAF domain-containing protein n=1 Tax=Desulforhabdus amnigena TaxID=40218 RepID=A0A9W6D2U0_9BACT|nr:flagellar basal body P-ring formation chaperone FlgA [Desulforhabdus amnigena]NLJ27628.1 flagellar basal body P-ring formation protein FlgA [Deltaproteobacteria bacterium]GLI33563.1 hypothetical protein DAMNIGENAA_09960 [Desulforhabdus amnigena]
MGGTLLQQSLMFFFVLQLISWGLPGGVWWPSFPCESQAYSQELNGLDRVEVKGKDVSLLDLFDSNTVPADLKVLLSRESIGQSPAVGEEKFVQGDRLRSYLNTFLSDHGYDPSEFTIRLPDRIVVVSESVQIHREKIEKIFREFILARISRDASDIVINNIRCDDNLSMPAGEVTYRVNASPGERCLGDVAVEIDFYVDGKKIDSAKVSGRVELYQNVLHSRHPMKRNSVVGPSDIEEKRINVADGAVGFVTQSDQVIGKRLLRDVGFLQPLKLEDFDEPLALKRGDAVTIVYEQPGLRVTASGKSLEEGSEGATIRVSNIKSRRTIDCRVVDGETVYAIP